MSAILSASELRAMPVGERAIVRASNSDITQWVGRPATVIRKDRTTWAVVTRGEPGCQNRGRFGTAEEVAEDLAYFDMMGSLPYSKSPGWS